MLDKERCEISSININSNGIQFLIDTGATVSCLPSNQFKPTEQCSIQLSAANGTAIQCNGNRDMQIVINDKIYKWQFHVCNVSQPIIGDDFLSHFGFLIDYKTNRLSTHTEQKHASSNINSIQSVNICHEINLNGNPKSNQFRRLYGDKLKAAKLWFDRMLQAGKCRPSNSPISSPLVVVNKNNNFRVCGDYRELNKNTIQDKYPIPRIDDIFHIVKDKVCFSTIDLEKAFLQVPMRESDIHKTAVTTPFGMFEFLFMPFGLRNAPATFQRLMDNILRPYPFAVAYLDDIIVASRTREEHEDHLRIIFDALKNSNLKTNIEKCHLNKEEIDFLGHHISKKGISPIRSKVQAIQEYDKPTTLKQLRRFCGMVNFYNRFIKNAAHIMSPLYDQIKKKSAKIRWTDELTEAFNNTKEALMHATQLSIFDDSIPACIRTDASAEIIAAVLEQKGKPIAFFSKHLSPCEKKYSTYDRELLAVYRAIKHFRYYMEAVTFTVYTDHRPLTHSQPKEPSHRQWRQLQYISEFNCTLEYCPGVENTVADALSRSTILQIDLKNNNTFPWPTDVILKKQRDELQHDADELLLNNSRLVLPPSLRKETFQNIHNPAHPGSKRFSQKNMSCIFCSSFFISKIPFLSDLKLHFLSNFVTFCKVHARSAQ